MGNRMSFKRSKSLKVFNMQSQESYQKKYEEVNEFRESYISDADNYDLSQKMLIIGPENVGKTEFYNQIITQEEFMLADGSLENSSHKKIYMIEGQEIPLVVIDCPSQLNIKSPTP